VHSIHRKWFHVTTPWRIHKLRMEERPPNMQGCCKYTEQADADSW